MMDILDGYFPYEFKEKYPDGGNELEFVLHN